MLGLPGDRLPTADEVAKAATATTIVFLGLGGHDKPSPPRAAKHSDMNKEEQ